jgi:hypothetical protein
MNSRKSIFALCCVAAPVSAAHCAEGEPLEICPGPYYRAEAPVRAATVKAGNAKTYFSMSGYADRQCPAPTESCNEKAYLMPGTLVLTGRERNGFLCTVSYGAKGEEIVGWFPQTALHERAPMAKPTAKDWIGAWKSLADTPGFVKPGDQRAKITIKSGAGGRLTLEGEKTYVVNDKDAPRSGAIRSDQLEPGPAVLAFVTGEEGESAKKTFEEAEEAGECAVRMTRVDRYLFVEDDNYCGGMGITFTGLYRR